MSTRSFIAIPVGTNNLRGIYCHYDGYPKHVGRLLVEFHNSFEAAKALTDGSHIRNLDSDGTVVRFGDRTSWEQYSNIKDILEGGFDYCYVFEDDGWVCYGHAGLTFPRSIVEFAIPGNKVTV